MAPVSRYSRAKPSQSSSCTVPTTWSVYREGSPPSRLISAAPWTIDAVAALLSEAPRPYSTPRSTVALNGSVRHELGSPTSTVSMWESKTMWTGPSPIRPITLPRPSTTTSS